MSANSVVVMDVSGWTLRIYGHGVAVEIKRPDGEVLFRQGDAAVAVLQDIAQMELRNPDMPSRLVLSRVMDWHA